MNIPNWKTHAKFIGIIIVAVLSVFYLGGYFDPPQQTQSLSAKSPYSIRIQEASWGLNCAEESANLLQELEQRAARATGEVYDTLVKEMDELKPLPTRNNALDAVKQQCEGAPACSISIGEGGLPLEQNNFCHYELSISYLCSSFDALQDGKTSHGEEAVNIDCADPMETEK